MEQERDKNIQKFKLGILLFISFSIISIIIAIIVSINNARSQVGITNAEEYLKNVPVKTKEILRQHLHRTVISNGANPSAIIDDAVIRPGSYSEFFEKKINTATFLIDIPSVKMTFWVSVSWSNNPDTVVPNPTYVECPLREESAYPDTPCKGSYTTDQDTASFVSWDNLYQLSYTYGQSTALKIINLLNPFVLENYHRKSSNPTVTPIIDETSLRKIPNQPGISYQLSVTINDLKANLVIQTDEGFGDQYIFAYMQNESDNKYTAQLLANDQNIINTVSNWAKNYFSAPNMEITVDKLD